MTTDLLLTYAVYFTPLVGVLLISQFIYQAARNRTRHYDNLKAKMAKKARAEMTASDARSPMKDAVTPVGEPIEAELERIKTSLTREEAVAAIRKIRGQADEILKAIERSGTAPT